MSGVPKLTTLAPESLKQLTLEQLVSIIVQQQTMIGQLQQEIERFKANQHTDNGRSS